MGARVVEVEKSKLGYAADFDSLVALGGSESAWFIVANSEL
jgi:hypothetical protein